MAVPFDCVDYELLWLRELVARELRTLRTAVNTRGAAGPH